jgi:hypothetical protein
MKYLFLLVLLVSARGWAMGDIYNGKSTSLPIMVSVGSYRACALDLEGVKCWGGTEESANRVPVLKSPIQVTAGVKHSCALDAEGVKCWGDNSVGQTNVPALNSPTQISSGDNVTCALDSEGVKCWGINNYGQLDIPPLKSPRQVIAGNFFVCALDLDGVKCWGYRKYGDTDAVPPLKSPVQVSIGGTYACVLDLEGVKCWGFDHYGLTYVPPLKSPTQVSAGWRHACALDAEGVKCWGNNDSGQTDVPPLKSPIQVSAGDLDTCALDLEGVKCWGRKKSPYPSTFVPALSFDLMEKAIPFVTSARAEYLKAIDNNSFKISAESYFLKYVLAAPAILGMDSSYITETYVPKFQEFLERYSLSFGPESYIRIVPDVEVNRNLAIASIKSALSVSLSFIPFDRQRSLQESLRAAGVASAAPMDNQKISDLLKQVDALNSEKQKLKSSSKTSFLADTLELAANWLREKAK